VFPLGGEWGAYYTPCPGLPCLTARFAKTNQRGTDPCLINQRKRGEGGRRLERAMKEGVGKSRAIPLEDGSEKDS